MTNQLKIPLCRCSPSAHPTRPAHLRFTLQSGKGLQFHAMSINMIETVIQVVQELVYGRADRISSSRQSVIVVAMFLFM
jgi:hypothetical protein